MGFQRRRRRFIRSGMFGFNPAALFAQGQQGAWYLAQPTYQGQQILFQDAAGTAPVVDDGDPVGLMLDLSPNGNHATQSVSADRPIYHTDGTLHWLSFNGTSSYLANADLTLGTLPFTIAAALKTSLLGSTSVLFSLGDTATSGGVWRITPELGVRASGGNELYDQTPTGTAPDVITSTFPGGGVSVTNASMYKNGTELGVLSWGAQSIDLVAGLGVFADADGSGILPGDFFGGVVTSEVLPLARRAGLENYLANLAGVLL